MSRPSNRQTAALASANCPVEIRVVAYHATYRADDRTEEVALSPRQPAMLERMGKVLDLTVVELIVTVVVVLGLISATALITARQGRRGLRQRLQALASRLGSDAPRKESPDLEEVLVHLERATDRADRSGGRSQLRGHSAPPRA